MSQVNALPTPHTRLRLARLVVESGWTYSAAAKMFMVSPSPTKTPEHIKRQIVRLRWRKRLGSVQIASQLGVPASTVHAVLVRCRINRLSHIDRVTFFRWSAPS